LDILRINATVNMNDVVKVTHQGFLGKGGKYRRARVFRIDITAENPYSVHFLDPGPYDSVNLSAKDFFPIPTKGVM